MTNTTGSSSIDARVVQVADGLKVVPKDVFKHAGDEVTIANIASVPVRVSFPSLQMDPPSADIDPRRLKTFVILDDPEPGIYPYVVEYAVRDRFDKQLVLRASGGSDPNIIIDI